MIFGSARVTKFSHKLQKPAGRMRDRFIPYLFIMPFLFSFIFFFFIPAFYSLYLSLTRYAGFGKIIYIGLNNYISLFQFGFFWMAVGNTFFYLFMHSVPVMILSFLLAVSIHSKLIRAKSLFKIGYFLPVTMASVAASLIWKVILGTRSGAINALLGTQLPFLDNTQWFRMSVVVVISWKSIGWFMTVYLAGLSTVSNEIKESALVDGASPFQALIHITIPIMKPIFLFAFIMDTLTSLKLFAEPRLLLASSSIPPEVNTIVGILVDNLQSGMFGKASAIGWVLFYMVLIISLIQLKILGGKENQIDA